MSDRLLRLGLVLGLVSVTAATAAAAFNPNTDPALVAWYQFEGNANDSSPNALHGTEHGGPTYAPGVYGLAVEMDGQDDYIDCGRDPKFDITAQITFAYWIKVRAFDREWNTVFAKGDNSYRSSRADFNMFMEAAVGGTSGNYLYTVTPVNDDQWHHVACVYDGSYFVIYIDGKEDAREASTGNIAVSANNVYIGDNSGATGRFWNGWIDDLRIYQRAFSPEEVAGLMSIKSETASDPVPPDQAIDVPRDASLAWTAGPYAASHDIYLGTTFADVNTASRADGKGVLADQGQAETVFEPAGLLAYGQTYYWRVDEVNAPPDSTVFKGEVWSFTAEPYGYPVTPVAATASSFQTGMSPDKTIDGSGLTGDLHGTEPTTMWLTAGIQPNWIQYEFDQAYKLYEMKVWNSNQLIESFLGFGAKNVTIETSTDGTTWTPVADVPEFSRAPGAPDYAANTTVDFGGAEAKFVKLTINSNWGGVAPQTGLAEVQFTYVPVQARQPEPASDATDVSIEATLNWRPGREATSHDVFFGTDRTAVGDETVAAQMVTEHTYVPASLDFGTTYYWKVNEIGAASAYRGDLWTFTTQEYAVIDDFESYTDQPGEEIFSAWIDGFTTGQSGSTVGYLTAANGTYGETAIVHGGKQSMPLQYDNTAAPFFSEAQRTFASAQNWTGNGADSLVVYFRGLAPAFAETASGSILMNAIGTDIWGTADQFRYAYKTLTGNGSMTARVDSLVNSNAWAKAGVMIRQSVQPDSVHAFMPITPGNSCSFQRRPTTGAASTSDNWAGTAVTAPYWVRITRTGNVFKAESSPDGTTWTALGTQQTITMSDPVLIGLALTSHDAAIATSATFSNISTTGNVTGAWQVAEIGATQPEGNSVEGLYLAVTDSSGKSQVVQHPDPAATAYMTWQPWTIPLSDFTSAGVKMTAVKSLTLGVGNKAAPKAGGTGTVYIDDIGFGKAAK
jgi:regulation of enolase protein 1 (concanavalin A-like superfamily)